MARFQTKKNFWASKTIWVAIFAFAANLAAEVFVDPSIAEQIHDASVWVLPFLMGALRYVTRDPVR